MWQIQKKIREENIVTFLPTREFSGLLNPRKSLKINGRGERIHGTLHGQPGQAGFRQKAPALLPRHAGAGTPSKRLNLHLRPEWSGREDLNLRPPGPEPDSKPY